MPFIEEAHRIFYEDENGNLLAEITFPLFSENVVNIDHTYVNEALRGQGVANQLMERTVSKLRKENWKAVPTCSYAKRWFEKNESQRDVLRK